ncbi:MAG: ATP-dependent DNA helicase DinG [Pseudomonadota bacterium]
MLTEAIKDEIQSGYREWLGARDFRARRGQREMIATVARTIAGTAPRLAVIEAGTGTGKTAAYALAAVPLGRALGKRVVISTATVALQEQVVLRDLPDLQRNAGIRFDFTLAKGRQRYVCLKQLDDQLRGGAQNKLIPDFDAGDDVARALYEVMLTRFGAGEWNGEIDAWADEVDREDWRRVTTDHRGCSNNRCSYFKQCPFFRARGQLDDADVIVVNHDLLLADLSLGGGAVLPEPEDCVYVIDEAHHLPGKTQQHFTRRLRVNSAHQWLESVATALGSLTQRFGRPPELESVAQQVAADCLTLAEPLSALRELIEDLDFEERDEDLATCRLALGAVPESLRAGTAELIPAVESISAGLERAFELLQEALDGDRSWPNAYEAEDWLGVVGQLQTRAEGVLGLVTDYAAAPVDGAPTQARWINRAFEDFELLSAPLLPGALLQAALWDTAGAVICTSATLTAAGQFDSFLERSGLPPETICLRIASPFDYPRIATLRVPRMRTDPRDFSGHSDEVAALLPGLLAERRSALVLFTSWRQLKEVRNLMPRDLADRVRWQGSGSKQALLVEHREAIDAGEDAYLAGVASFAEGVDLPDDYCRHVIVIKLPFAVPDDPLDQALAEWIEAQGRNAFMEISVPDATLRLVQSCGRLIRHEGDHGLITLLDRRIVQARYGQVLLDSLPPYARDLSYQVPAAG